jgi:hypothetical protein
MAGKGDRDRTVDREAYRRGWERVFGGGRGVDRHDKRHDVKPIEGTSKGYVLEES